VADVRVIVRSLFVTTSVAVFLVAGLRDVSYSGDPGGARETPPYTLGVFPFMSLSRLEEMFAPISTGLSERLGRSVFFRSSSSFEEFMAKLSRETYDIGFVQPFDYVKIAAPSGYKPLVARSDPLYAEIVVRSDSDIKEIRELRGAVVALPPDVAAVSYLTRSVILDAGLSFKHDVTLRHVKTHDSCLQLVLIREVSACGTAPAPLAVFQKKMGVQFRLLKRSSVIPGSLFVVHPRVPEQDRAAIREALLSGEMYPVLKEWAPSAGGQPFKPVNDSDYDLVRRLLEEVR
jgi:phosphonate transport system substrate-binding protein